MDVATLGTLLASVSGSTEAVVPLVRAVRSWLHRGENSVPWTVELTVGNRSLRLTAASSEQPDRLVDEFLHVIAER
jgi:hypothetical protein